ncbi:MAG: MotA/TolQ/ExbB proton channel family protein [Acidobacteriota bacterium]|nr:MotA/TolQ/ExbB proton channel family protein [Acidobacteriota bacterium]
MLFLAQEYFGGFWSLVVGSGPIGQAVLIVLLAFSIVSWAIIFKKVRFYQEVTQQSQEFYGLFRKSTSLSKLYRECQSYSQSPLAGIFKRGYEELNYQLKTDPSSSDTFEESDMKGISKSLDGLQRTLQKSAQTEMTMLEDSLSWLATTGTVTPFIGLLGTVIGIINAFQGLGEGSVSTIQAVAPGISEALVATAGGLFAAIPAVIAYNYFIDRLKVLGVTIDDFSVEFLNTIERSF